MPSAVGTGDVTSLSLIGLKAAQKSQQTLAQVVVQAADNAKAIASLPPPGSGRGQNVDIVA
jgi:hypothetical protein